MRRFKRHTPLKAAATAISLVFSPHSLATVHPEVQQSIQQESSNASAFASFHTLAQDGDTHAQLVLSILFRSGIEVDKDEEEAFHWCKLAAEGGLLEAQYQLGMMFLQGIGVSEDDEQALEWIWLAADRGNQQAQQTLQYILHNDFTTGC